MQGTFKPLFINLPMHPKKLSTEIGKRDFTVPEKNINTIRILL